MDSTSLLNEIRDRRTLEQAYAYALNDQQKGPYTDFFELDHAYAHQDRMLDELEDELATPETYQQRPAYAYFMPKSTLCVRRMIHLNFKDLVLRNAFALVFGGILDPALEKTCFGNRLATDYVNRRSLLAYYATESWPKFCRWQREESERHSILLRTDISSFYDSVSHDYLITSLATELTVPTDSRLMRLFRAVLEVPVIAYSLQTKDVGPSPMVMHQGLPIGSESEGVFANLFLKSIDKAMAARDGLAFGRYCDDMRIFADEPAEVLEAVQLLQELLLAKGLNLNTTKTQWAQTKGEMEQLISQDVNQYLLSHQDEPGPGIEPDERPANLSEWIDRPFHEFDRKFAPDPEVKNAADAKDFCKYLSQQLPQVSITYSSEDIDLDAPIDEQKQAIEDKYNNWLENLVDKRGLVTRSPQQVAMLGEVLRKWSGSTKHAAWLLAQSAFFAQVNSAAQEKARQVLLDILEDRHVHAYAKGRLIRHLVKHRRSWRGPQQPTVMTMRVDSLGPSREWELLSRVWGELRDSTNRQDEAHTLDMDKYDCFLFDLWEGASEADKNRLLQIVADLLKIPAFDVTIVTLYMVFLLVCRFSDWDNRKVLEEMREWVRVTSASTADPYLHCLHYVQSRLTV